MYLYVILHFACWKCLVPEPLHVWCLDQDLFCYADGDFDVPGPFRPSQQSFSNVGTGLPWLNQYQARINVSCERTQSSDAGEVEPAALQSRVKHSTIEPLRSHDFSGGRRDFATSAC